MQWVTKDEDKAPPFQEDRGGETLPLKSVECEISHPWLLAHVPMDRRVGYGPASLRNTCGIPPTPVRPRVASFHPS